ncbi:hypothetical protein FHT02_003345 [Sphingomonas xinjiangensis]|uniref:Ice-binding protein C-terminal domain-containing protein n=1 Tax=Sphingomonas xinjiangensis TaxID=643568 RepID=A0A840YJ00_9SPHN|nr:PEPxxWA-CTERM sorting domain-containing protein [Sphingomonas xinjiangensis]MBB5712089.1 hypothetical protein [Sphingomonas xinjiangensis]
MAAVALPAAAQAAITINVDQIGSSVVLNGSGMFDTAGLKVYSSGNQGSPTINPAFGVVQTGASAPITIFTGLSGPILGYKQSVQRATAASGDVFGVSQYLGAIYLPTDYLSGAALSGTSTYVNSTFASLGLTPGQYVFRSPADTVTLNIGLASAVPEPATWAMMLLGVGGIGSSMRRRKNAARRTAAFN